MTDNEYRLLCWKLEYQLIDKMGWDRYLAWREANVLPHNANGGLTYQQYFGILQDAMNDEAERIDLHELHQMETELRHG